MASRDRGIGLRDVSPSRRFAELLALTAFAIAQPVLDVTGRSPDFFVYRQASRWDVRLLIVLVVLGPPVLLWLAESAIGLVSRRAGRAAHVVLTALLFGSVAVQVGKQAGVTGIPVALLAVVAGAALAALAVRVAGFRQVVAYAAPAPLVFALLFVVGSPAGALARPSQAGTVAAVAAKRPPVVVLLLDEFPTRSLLDDAGRVDARLFPNFAKLAEASTWYPNATGTSGWTPWAVPAMLSGRYPERAAAPHYGQHPRNLFTLLAQSYDIKAFESIAQLCPPSTCAGVPAGRDTGLLPLLKDTAVVAKEIVSPYPAPQREGAEFAEAAAAGEAETDPKFRFGQVRVNQPARFTAFLDGLVPTERPTLHFLHLLLPHGTHHLLPSGNSYEVGPMRHVLPKAADPRVLPDEPKLSTLARQRMLLQLVYTDGLIGQLLDRLKATGLWDDALLAVTADHGVAFGPGGYWRWIDEGNTADVAWVPFFLKLPGQDAARVDDRNVEGVDLLPTIADVLDVEVPWPMDGRSALGEPRPTPEKRWYDQPGEPRTIDARRWLARARTGIAGETARPELGPNGLFAVGDVAPLYGREVADLTVGPPAPARAKLAVDVGRVDTRSGDVPAMLWGDLDRPLGPPARWLAVSVNGTVAGGVVALPGLYDGAWRFYGVVDDRFFADGRNDVRLYTMEGSVLHPIEAAP